MDEPDELLVVVDENDNILRSVPKLEVYEKKLTHRICHVLVFNKKGEMLLQLRSKNKFFSPDKWITAASGHVTAGESYEEGALRELQEELGVTGDLAFLYKDFYTTEQGLGKFLAFFKTVHEGPFGINEREVEKVEFFSIEKIRGMVKTGEKIHPELEFLFEKHF